MQPLPYVCVCVCKICMIPHTNTQKYTHARQGEHTNTHTHTHTPYLRKTDTTTHTSERELTKLEGNTRVTRLRERPKGARSKLMESSKYEY
jgi:hypothetical protein